MAPFLPIVSISRSQAVRIGHGPNAAPPSITYNSGNPQTGGLPYLFYADLADGNVRKDLQHHQAIGAILEMGAPSLTVWSDLFKVSGLAVSNGTGFALSVASGTIQSRFYGAQLAVSAQTVTPAAPSSTDRTDLVVVSPAGVVSIIQGAAAGAAATYEVDSVATSGTPTGGTITLGFTYNGFNYTTGTIAYNASASTVASAILAATGGPALPSGSLTGSGGPLTTAAVTLTASSALEGPISNQRVVANALTGGTNPSATFTQTTAGSGSLTSGYGGSTLPLATVFIPSTATSNSNYTTTSVALTS